MTKDSFNTGRQLPGAYVLLEALQREGVDTIFGYPGGAVLPIYDALFHTPSIRHVLTRHEQGAVHAADGYARSTGKPGVVIATSGPGATNLVTGIATAYMDSVPLVAITGQVALSLLGKDSFQEADITGITLPITKYNYLVKDPNELAYVIHEAFYVATSGRPGPVLIDIPKDVQSALVSFDSYPPAKLALPGYQLTENHLDEKLARLVQALEKSRKPVLFVGGGVINSGACTELLKLAEKTGIPVAYSIMGKGAFPDNHALCLGLVGMHGLVHTNYAFTECDLLLGLGVRFSDRVIGKVNEFCPKATIIHVDIDPAEINKNVRVPFSIVGDVKNVLNKLLALLEDFQQDYSSWRRQIAGWKEQYPLRYENNGLKAQFIIQQINELTKGEAFITTEVGQNQMWAAQYCQTLKPRTFITSGGLGTMGYGFPAAIGVQMAHPDAVVFDIAGDGSIQMNSQELATAVQYELPINVVILNNNYLGMVRQWQELFFDRRYSHVDLVNPDFVKLAEAYGAVGLRVEKPEEVRPALEEAIKSKKTYVLDCLIDREENVFPMVPAGGAIHDMLGR